MARLTGTPPVLLSASPKRAHVGREAVGRLVNICVWSLLRGSLEGTGGEAVPAISHAPAA